MDTRPFLVTGGAGFIGSHLVDRLLQEGHPVRVIDDFSTGQWSNLESLRGHPRLSVVQSAVSRHTDLARDVAGAQAVFHLAAAVGVELVVAHPRRCIETNLHETQSLLEAAIPARVPVVFTSTSEVYGRSDKPWFSEEDDLQIGPPHLSRWSYASSKLLDEFLVLACHAEHGLPVVITRLFNIVGPRQTGRWGMVLPRFIEAARSGQALRVHGDGRQARCLCHVADTVEALLRLHRAPAANGQVINVGNDDETSILDLARIVIEECRSSSRIELLPYDQAFKAGFQDMPRRRPDLRKLERLTGFRPASTTREIVRRIVQETGGGTGNQYRTRK